MRCFGILLLFTLAVSAFGQDCQPGGSSKQILEKLEIPDDLRLPAAQRLEVKLKMLQQALAAAPQDVALHEAYQEARIRGIETNRTAVIAEYEQLLAKNPTDPVFLYLAANAQAGRNTRAAIANLEQAIQLAPNFGAPHLLLARIYFSSNYWDNDRTKRHLERFTALCPASVRVIPALRWSKDEALRRQEVTRLRKNIEVRSDSEVVGTYPALWGLESTFENSHQQSENRARMLHDIDRLFGPKFVRNSTWLTTIQATRFFDDIPDDLRTKAQHEVARLYPYSDATLHEEYANAVGDEPYPEDGAPGQITAFVRRSWQATLPLLKKWPNTQWLADRAARDIAEDRSASAEEIHQIVGMFLNAVQQDPEGVPTLPPEPISVAQSFVDRGGPFDDVPALVLAGLAATDRNFAAEGANDVSGTTASTLTRQHDTFYVMGYLPLTEAYIHLGRLSEAKDVLTKMESKLETIRPQENATSMEKVRFAQFAAPYWFVRGLYAEKEERKIDALVDYRNSLALYPPRRPRPDRRDDVMTAAQRLWKQLGGTGQGWNDWASQSSLTGFYAGEGGTEGWSKLAESSPGVVLTDSLGNRWNPGDLAKKTTFIAMWASWCAPCRAELPYLAKLYSRFQNRKDVAILALNVDDDPKAMTIALQEMKISVPSIEARDFAYSIVPPMALPANWIISPQKIQMFWISGDSHEEWLEKATIAINNASTGK